MNVERIRDFTNVARQLQEFFDDIEDTPADHVNAELHEYIKKQRHHVFFTLGYAMGFDKDREL
jgi:hypothetical protein